ncbi:hypothetical protein HK096_000614, partial [Nowakowskiella sp. JEL0078]
ELGLVHFISIKTNDGCNAGQVLSTKEECKQTGCHDSEYDCFWKSHKQRIHDFGRD